MAPRIETSPPLPSGPLTADGAVAALGRLNLPLLLALASVYLIWGSTYLAMHIAVEELPPLLMGAVRFVAGGLILLGVAALRGERLPTARQWRAALPIGALMFLGGNGFVAIAMQTIDSSVAAVVCATMPLWVAVLSAASGERPSVREWLGLGVGFAGVVALFGGASLGGDPVHAALILASPIAWAAGSVLARRLPVATGVSGSALQMITGGVAVGLVALARGERFTAGASAEAWLAVAYLVVFGSLIAFTAYNWLLRNTRPALATSYAFVNPAIAVVLGAAIGGEHLGADAIVATGLIVGAVALVVTGKRR